MPETVSSSMTARIQAQIPKILTAWLESIREKVAAARDRDDAFLVNNVPAFLEHLATIAGGESDPHRYDLILKCAKDHGHQRAGAPPYSVSQVILEFTLLRETLLSLVDTTDEPLSTRDLLALTRIFDASIGSATEEFVFAARTVTQGETEEQLKTWLHEHTGFLRQRETDLASEFYDGTNRPGELAVISTGRLRSAAKHGSFLAESENRLRLIFAHAAVGFSVSTKAGEIIEANPRFQEITGFSLAELRQLTIPDLIHPDDRARDAQTLATLTEGKVSHLIVEKRFIKKNKSVVWVRNSVSVVPGDDGEELVIRVAEDVTALREADRELRAAQNALERERQKFESIFTDASTSMAVLSGSNFQYEIVNKSYSDLFENRPLIGRTLVEALPELVSQPFPEHARRVFETGVPYVEREARAFLRRGPDTPIEERFFDQTYSRMLDAQGKPYGVFIHAVEVTDRVQARRELEEAAERFRIAVETANMGTWTLDPQTQIVYWSERTRELFGFPKEEAVHLDRALDRIHPEDIDRVRAAIAASLDPNGTGDYQIEYRICHDDGDIRWVALLGKSFFTETPEGRIVTRFTGNVLDVTDRVLAEVALRDAKERAELASAAKSAFLANMSHEIRTPLGAIMGFVGLIRDEGLSQEMLLEYVSVVERNSTQLMRIIDDILDLSKVEAGMMLIEHIDFSLVEVLSDFGSLMGFRAREKGILFELKAKTELPDLINSDSTRLRQILTNIVGNAIKFTERGSVQLFVSYHDEVVEFEVRDTGRGISPDQVEKLFQPFAQADASTTRKYGGTGLGLVLTRRLCEAMGGTFALKESQLGGGSVFTATVRVQRPKASQMIKALGFASEPIRNAGAQTLLRDLKVLLVEDSPDNQALFSIYLNRAGAKIDIASDGARGVQMALADGYDVVLMDVQMPIMDGITAVRKLREQKYAKPIIALTAHAMKEERQRCLEAGYTEFLSKPVNRNDLIETLAKYKR